MTAFISKPVIECKCEYLQKYRKYNFVAGMLSHKNVVNSIIRSELQMSLVG